jgi:hypothetical protein
MWYTLRHDGTAIGFVELPARELAAARLVPVDHYATIEQTVREATAAFLELGVFGAAALPIGHGAARILRLRRALARANRLRLELIGDTGEVVHANFINVLETPADGQPVVVAGFGLAPALVGAALLATPPGGGARA